MTEMQYAVRAARARLVSGGRLMTISAPRRNHAAWVGPLLSDVEREAVRAWGPAHEEGLPGQVIARPASFLVELDGTISWRGLTDNRRVWLRPEELLEALGADP